MRARTWIKGHKTTLAVVALAVIVTSLVTLVIAEQKSATVRIHWTILPFQELRIVGSTAHGSSITTSYTMPQPDALDLQRGYIEEMDPITLNVNSNIPWKVQVWTEDSDMGASKDGLVTKPVSDFQLRVHGGTYFSISNAPQILTSGNRGSFSIGVDYRILLGKDYHPGDYGLDVVYTIMPM